MSKPIAAELLALHRDELLRFIKQRIDCPETALDILHDCFMRFSNYLERHQVQNPRAFLYKMAANQTIDHIRQQRRADDRRIEFEAWPELIDPAPSPEDTIAARQRMAMLERVIAEMPEKNRQIFVMRHIQHLSFTEISQVTGLAYNSIFKYLNEALSFCQKRMPD